jgi:hypothetical protein
MILAESTVDLVTPTGPMHAATVVPLPSKIKQRFATIADAAPGIIVEDKKFSIRVECRPSTPFGVATWKTAAAVRNVRVLAREAGV